MKSFIQRSALLLILSGILFLNNGCSEKVEGVTADEAADFVMSVLEPKDRDLRRRESREGKEIMNLSRGKTKIGFDQILFVDGASKVNMFMGPWVKITFIPTERGRSAKVIIRAYSGLGTSSRDQDAEKKWGKILADAAPVKPVRKIKKGSDE